MLLVLGAFFYVFSLVDGRLGDNVCSNLLDYATILVNNNCWYNPDIYASPESIIANHGYYLQTHTVTTEDGYILNMFRISKKPTFVAHRKVVFLHHGMAADSVQWITFGRRSIAFLLADLDYDVWMANARGTANSDRHVNKKLGSKNYWNFGFHEMGVYDLPASLEHVANITGQLGEIVYIGHSMGTTASYIYATEKAAHANKHIKGIISVAPIAFLSELKSPLFLMVPIIKPINTFLNTIGIYVVNNQKPAENLKPCLSFPLIGICLGFWYLIGGQSTEQSYEDVPIYFSNLPAPVTTKGLAHYSQILLKGGRFQKYDYGLDNFRIYGSFIPPVYDVTKITLPVHMFYGLADTLAVDTDVLTLFNNLRTRKKSMQVIPTNTSIKFSHFDFITSKHIAKHFIPYLQIKIQEILNT
ncbi:PREDICTED: lipase 3-like [Nicrophorus vespilloides]|uniref:Lipase n=1 Tax=Nicrophorus vespilloides TaxID=110193 RepID=A0ABM1N1P2_NICVS|nr:PREDICTED: lipase 3-like [Nicrophorus vespilloides]